MRPSWGLPAVALVAVLGGACHGAPPGAAVPARSCSLTVWYQPASTEDAVHLVGSWDAWSRPGRAFDAQPGGWLATRLDDLAAGPYEYAIDEAGTLLPDPGLGTTAFHDGQEVSWVQIPDCGTPATTVASVQGGTSGSASIDATFLASRSGDALDPASVTLETLHGAAPATVASSAVPSQGTIHLDLGGLPSGKSTLAIHAKDVKGRDADAGVATVWIEPRPFDWRDAVIYEVMVDRYRARDGSALAPPASMGGRAGGSVGGVRAAIESGEIGLLGVNTIWLTPLYANPAGAWPGLDGRPYTGYHGYWPAESRTTEPFMADEPDVDALVVSAHAHGMRILFDVVPHHVHSEHPYWVANDSSGWFQDVAGSCVCGVGSCSWATSETACWFASYLPTLDWTNDDVAATVTSDVQWWLDHFDGDGVRIDAVPMMPRAAVRRIAAAIRARYDGPSHRTYVLGENYVPQQGFPSLRYFLGPSGLDGEFHFPLMWALQAAFANEGQSLVDVDAAVNDGEQAFAGSGAVMSLILDNHDTARFSTVVGGDASGDTWTPAPQSTDPTVYARTQAALGILMTLPGAPTLYYGDEVALAGRSDPDSRRVMPAEQDLGVLQTQTRDVVRTLGKARACSDALRRGTYRTLYVDPERLLYAREVPGEPSVVVDVQRSPATPLSAPLPGIAGGAWVDVLSGRNVSLIPELTTLPAAPFSVALYVPASSPCAPGANP